MRLNSTTKPIFLWMFPQIICVHCKSQGSKKKSLFSKFCANCANFAQLSQVHLILKYKNFDNERGINFGKTFADCNTKRRSLKYILCYNRKKSFRNAWSIISCYNHFPFNYCVSCKKRRSINLTDFSLDCKWESLIVLFQSVLVHMYCEILKKSTLHVTNILNKRTF